MTISILGIDSARSRVISHTARRLESSLPSAACFPPPNFRFVAADLEVRAGLKITVSPGFPQNHPILASWASFFLDSFSINVGYAWNKRTPCVVTKPFGSVLSCCSLCRPRRMPTMRRPESFKQISRLLMDSWISIRVSLQVFGRRWLFLIKGATCLAGGNYPISGWKGGFLPPERLSLSGFSENRVRPAMAPPHRHLENTRKGRSSSP
ncbi:hypothetical protein [Rhizobium rhizogenes]|uniref:hypothetical protein n=1 Tax=Rhizobium rhizogenes TaxID=359 RepID=UPI00122F3232|nr:hypothetical protein [Rhizobium rhizogenes]